MDRDQLSRIKQLVASAEELQSPARERFLAENCRDAEERRLVDEQLNLSVPTNFMASPALPGPKNAQVLKAGDRIDRYQLVRLLGQGGMGAVYQARDLELNRMVALKLIRPELADQAGILKRFKQELLLAQKVTHPNVVRIYDFGVAGDSRFITMEFVDGRELADILKERKKLPPEEAAAIVAQVCRGLSAAHDAGIVHRDLKPANVMIDRQGRVVIMDFGIAHSMEAAISAELSTSTLLFSSSTNAKPAEPLATQAGTFIGTPSFMSPEQALRRRVDHRSDIFAAGLLLHHLITGRLPQRGDSLEDLLEQRAKQPIQSLRLAEPSVPPSLDRIAMRALEIQVEKRYQTVAELAAALDGWRESVSPKAATTSRRKPLMAAACAAALAVAGLVYYRIQPAGPAVQPANVKVLVNDFQNTTGNPVLDGALEPMVGLCLEGATFITVFDRIQAHRLASELADSQVVDLNVGQILARREGIGILITGVIKRDGDQFNLSVQALDAATQKEIASQSSKVPTLDSLPRSVSAAAAEIRNRLGDTTPAAAQALAAETFTSRSIEAAQEYARAQEFQWKADQQSALTAYRRSVEKDPDFGRAYAGMAATLANMGRRTEAEEMYGLALSKIDRMSDREKFRTRGSYYLFHREYQKATEQFQALIARFPSDTAGVGNLALSYFYQRNLTAAVQHGKRAVEFYPNNVLQLNNLGLYEMYGGNFDAAIATSAKVLKLNPKYRKAYLCLGLSQLAQGKTQEAVDAFDQMAKLDPQGLSMAALAKADMALYEGRGSEAVALLEPAIQVDLTAGDKGRAASKLIALGEARLANGQLPQAADAAARAVATSSQDQTLFAAAMIYLRAGNEPKAKALAATLADRLGPEPVALAKVIEAELLLQRKEPREAIRILQAAQPSADTWLGRFALGRAYLDAGVFPQADAELEACLTRKGEALAVFLDDEPTFRYLPNVYYYQARARQGLSSPGAAGQFRTFLKIKEKAAPDALIKDATARLASIAPRK